MVTCFSRWGLTVNEDTPTLYFPVPTPGMMLLNDADCHSVFRPSLAATALNSSTSKPFTVLPSVSRNSLGAYVESVPMVSFPADLMSAGTFAARALSTDDDGVGAEPVPVPLLSFDSPPHAASATVMVAAAITPRTARRARELRNMFTPVECVAIGSGHAEVGVLHRRIVQQLRAGAGFDDPAGLQHVRPVRPGQCLLRVLLDQQDGRALLVDFHDDVEDLLDQHRRQAHRRLVQQEQFRPAHER